MSRTRIAAIALATGCIAIMAFYLWSTAGKPPVVDLWPSGAPIDRSGATEDIHVRMTAYLPPPDRATGIGVLICPGGGYSFHVVEQEGHAIARWLGANGIAGFVLEYRMPQGRPEVPLLDAERALQIVREHSEDWGVRPDRLGVMGFSAGGHVAASAATLLEPAERPAFAILIYPVVTMGEGAHELSKKRLLGDAPPSSLVRRFSAEHQVTDSTPPMFIVHAVNDQLVPIDGSRRLHAALSAKGVQNELLELPDGDHTLGNWHGPIWEQMKAASLDWLLARFEER